MTIISLREQVKKGTLAVKTLRISRLKNGLPFMINVKGLEEGLCYMEYPDGSIHLVEKSTDGNDFKTLDVLGMSEALELRRRFNLD